MAKNKYTNWIIIVVAIGLIAIFWVFILLPKEQRTVSNGFTLFGTYLSLCGLLVAYLQIKSVKEISEETQKAITNSLNRVNQILSVSELSKSAKVIQEIQTSLQNNKLELALIRMKDLKYILIQIKYNADLKEYTQDFLYNKNITDLANDVNNLHDQISGIKKGVNFSKLNQNLENLSTVISDFENKLKYKSDDTE